ncbi:MAG: hypothetical protein GY855_08240 [candidate division Zixibacteria bacterium]|nr:hypothetical protein [candidate division Zixibacteria bacterium]
MSLVEFLQIWIAAFFTLSLFSFLYKDNSFYKLAEHIFAGLSAGYYVGLIWNSVILQQMINPMMDNGKWWLVFPGLLGALMFSRFFKGYNWISRISLAFVMGNTAGIFILSELHGKVLPQIQSTMLSLDPSQGFGNLLLSLVIAIGVISTLIYFYFSKEHKGVLGGVARVGIWFIMISFGAHFGYTVMGRISLLIGRVQFLIHEWGGSIIRLFS